ncbi:DMP19 family protein [Shewanella putrefaciens]|nr:DMP19 family protein [Shewanella putrefaciens]
MDLAKILIEEEGDKSQAILELNIRIAQKIESPDIDIFEILSPTELYILLISRINVYVCNGGYEHYFYYSGQYTKETVQAISHVGLNNLLFNYQAALKVFDNNLIPKEDEKRQKLINGLTEKQREVLDELSSEYYDIAHLEELFDYAYEHQSDISV